MSTHFDNKNRKLQKLSISTNDYLAVLRPTPGAPAELYCLGQLPDRRLPTVAIVGSRKPTNYGREITRQLGEALARRGVVIVSGLALGIDAVAHQAALDAGGITIAVQANGLHAINPPSNRQLGEAIIAKGGAVLSEYEPGVEPLKHHFLARNRLVSGLADCVVVTEAAARSGTLNTVAHALEQGREVYAVPGNITSPMSAGCNQLIAQGARPLLTVDQFIAELFPRDQSVTQQILPLGSTELETRIIAALADGIRDGDALLARCEAKPAEFSTALTMLEIGGIITPLGANQWSLR